MTKVGHELMLKLTKLADVYLELLSAVIPADGYALYLYYPNQARPSFIYPAGVSPEFLYRYHKLLGNRDDPVLSYIRYTGRAGHNELPEVRNSWLKDPASKLFRDKGFRFVMKTPVIIRSSLVGSLNFARKDPEFQSCELQKSGILAKVLSTLLESFSNSGESGKRKKAERIAPAIGAQLDFESNLLRKLTTREAEVLDLLLEGLTYEEIARVLVITRNTVKRHLKSIYGKLGVGSRRQLLPLLLQR